MMSTENKNVKNEELNNEQKAEVQATEAQSEQQEVDMKEKKKFDWKGLGKKVLIGAGATAGAAVMFGLGYLTGSHSGDDSSQSDAPVDDSVSTESAE